MSVRRIRWIAILLTVLIAVTGCGEGTSQQKNATPTPVPTPIVARKPTYEVKRGEVVKTLEFTGRIAPVTEEDLFFRTSGFVGTVQASTYDEVQAGDILAELDVTDLKNQLEQAKTALESARRNNERQISDAEADLRAAELHLARTKADNPEPRVIQAEVSLERAEEALTRAQENYNQAWDPARDWELDVKWRKDALEAEREGTERALGEAQRNLRVAKARHQEALQAREVYQYNVQLQEQEVALARQRLERLEAGLDIKQRELAVTRIQDQLSAARIAAPFDGQIAGVKVDEGDKVGAHETVMLIRDLSELEMSARLQDSQMGELTEGMTVTCAPSNRPEEEFEGKIRRLPYPYGGGGEIGAGEEEEDQTTRISSDVSFDDVGLELGDLVHVTVVLKRKEDVVWLPPQAIRSFEGRKFVVVQAGEGRRRVDVKVGIEGEDRVEIEEGLSEGQVVIGS